MRADAQRNRARVLAAATEAFAAEGLAVPLDEIARRAGVGAGTVYRHFPTKEALFEAVMLDRITRLTEYAKTLAEAEDPGAAFFEFLRRMVFGAASSKDLIDALIGQELSGAGLIVAAKRDLHQAGAELLTRAQRASAVRADIGGTELMTLLSGTTLALQQNPADGEIVFAVLRDGLRAQIPT
ncbi:MAG TPA: helix-turn-helix domain-containing protein [Actinophytocola sp.]|uniref:TetR/AcrR family transcriptional regulator n=1 Tax=Actinophytocola sp. TaxID=1872138 RepID=UPI002DDCCF33|nr:helix-turn-helix domain-containing protein [Actinophytocola sp.]HEV2780424.1 helix-turn-helix domain-containing protein [Actinophytocola sp.]